LAEVTLRPPQEWPRGARVEFRNDRRIVLRFLLATSRPQTLEVRFLDISASH
jgi:hypothetical protein